MLLERLPVTQLLLAQASALNIRIEAVGKGRCIGLCIGTEHYHAWLCNRSSDYWTARVSLLDTPGRVNLVVCETHDSVLPIRVLSLDSGTLYGALKPPAWYAPEKRGTRSGSTVFLGQLLSGVAEAYTTLDTLPESTRYRYLARVKAILRGKRGRPVRVA